VDGEISGGFLCYERADKGRFTIPTAVIERFRAGSPNASEFIVSPVQILQHEQHRLTGGQDVNGLDHFAKHAVTRRAHDRPLQSLEAGCALVRNPAALRHAFSYHPSYYNFEVEATNYYDMGPQNSRGFRALKIWLALQHAGAGAYRQMIQDDITLARYLYDLAADHPELEPITNHLSITTLGYVPQDLRAGLGSKPAEDNLNHLNQRLLAAIEKSGEAFVSNAVVDGKYALRFCIVNFRASPGDIEAMQNLVVHLGRQTHAELSSPTNSQAHDTRNR
jgi:glutamate/tyrosine decarboxylase-like PLP-dependent enzyme